MYGIVVIYLRETALVIDIRDPDIKVEVAAQGNAVTITGPKEQKVSVEPGERQLKVSHAGLETLTQSFELKKGDKKVLVVRLVDKKLVAQLDKIDLMPQEIERPSEVNTALPTASKAPETAPLMNLATANNERSVWRGPISSFTQVARSKWREEVNDGSAFYNFDEVARTTEFVELIDNTRAVGGCRVRLRDSDSQGIWGGRDNDWVPFQSGRWEKSSPPGMNSILEPPKVSKTDLPQSLVAPFDGDSARKAQENWARYLHYEAEVTNTSGVKLLLIPPGRFEMGSRDSLEQLRKAFPVEMSSNAEFLQVHGEWPVHEVTITKPFYLGKYEITKREFKQFVDETGYRTDADNDGTAGNGARLDGEKYVVDWQPGHTWKNWGHAQPDDAPVVNVSYNDAAKFCDWLSKREGKSYRLPTEAEWEYACRAGTVSRYDNGDDPEQVTQIANVRDATWTTEFDERPSLQPALRSSDGYAALSPVGKLQPNHFGLYDMLGNAWEVCADWYGEDYYLHSPERDPTGPIAPTTDNMRVRRGGSWCAGAMQCRAARRQPCSQNRGMWNYGFRIALTVDGKPFQKLPTTANIEKVKDPDRRAAKAILALGGSIKIHVNDEWREIGSGQALPDEQFQLTRIELRDKPALTDADLEPLEGVANLGEVVLSDLPNVTDAIITHLHNSTGLESFWFDNGRVGDAGMARLARFTRLKSLGLRGTQVTDAGFAHVESLTQLELLALGGTQITAPELSMFEGFHS